MICMACENGNFKPLYKKREFMLVKCLNCGLVQVEGAEIRYDLKYYDYYKDRMLLPRDEIFSHVTEARYKGLLKGLEKYREKNRILDIGCGEGHFVSVANKLNWQAVGIEMADSAIQVCRKFNINVTKGDLLGFDAPDEHYDVITMFEVLEHLARPSDYLRKANDLLRRKGVLVLTTPNFNCITRFFLNKDWSWINEEHLFYFVPKTLSTLLRMNNFKIIRFNVKHVTFPELYSFYFLKNKSCNIYSKNQDIRKAIERNYFLLFTKYCANKFLNLTKLGEVIECVCEKA